jgi:hypothetical protein
MSLLLPGGIFGSDIRVMILSILLFAPNIWSALEHGVPEALRDLISTFTRNNKKCEARHAVLPANFTQEALTRLAKCPGCSCGAP